MAARVWRLEPLISPAILAAVGGLGAVCAWAYWPTLTALAGRWATDPQYSHGYLVPGFALALLWMRARQTERASLRASWLGLPILAAGLLLWLASAYAYNDWLEACSMLICLAGLAGLLGGLPALRWSWPSVAFLLFMVPLPWGVERSLAYPLRTVATVASNYALQTIGLPSVAEGHTILLRQTPLLIAEACSGLSMLVIFVALSTAMAIVVRRPWWERLLIVLSALPVAVLSNVVRITVTGLMHEWVGREMADLVFHDLAGWLMMPFALVVLWLELWLLGKLFVEVAPDGPMPLRMTNA